MDSLVQYNSESELSEPISPVNMENTTPVTTAGPAGGSQPQADPATEPELPADEAEAQAEVKTETLPDMNRIVIGYWKSSSGNGAVDKPGVTVQSKGFEEAPDAILQAVQQLQWAG
ncbi:hypothetical protein GE09DRAFT_1294939 [Coniochaeta sp. 2T2.1]|nr:hypothetical protein GE09DRAFT_1294939 [Coniochaeta sp. 2T2.1]